MTNKQKSFIRNRMLQTIRYSNRSGSHRNCFRYYPNNSEEHEDTKYFIFKKLIKNGFEVWTEAIFTDGNRCDLLAIKEGKGYIIEVETNPDSKTLAEKNKYPDDFEIIIINTKEFNINQFEL